VTSVWVGFHQGNIDMVPPTTRIPVYGGTWPTEIWRLFMVHATQGMTPEPFPVPRVGYVTVAVDTTQDPYCLPNRYTLPADIQTVQFIQGTQPTAVCTTPTKAQSLVLPSVIGLHTIGAIDALQRAGFNVQVAEARSTQPAGSVIYQSPSAGTSAPSSSTVTIPVAEPPASSGG
jgi:membrane peptidoglycan carboxypeptidase